MLSSYTYDVLVASFACVCMRECEVPYKSHTLLRKNASSPSLVNIIIVSFIETTSPIDLAKQIRHEINQQTQCTASIGIGHNVLIARLCTRKAKPDGQYHVHGQHMVQEFIGKY